MKRIEYKEGKIQIILGDAQTILDTIQENTVDLVLTDPPYFLDKLDEGWKHEEILKGKNSCGVVKNLPMGMKFSPQQSKKFYEWFRPIAKKIRRVLKPGGWFISFSHPRLFHRLILALEDENFWLRDTFIWIYTQNQPKAFSLSHFLEKINLPEKEREKIEEELKIFKVPKVKSCYEPIIVAQKPPEKTLLDNWIKYGVGLFNVQLKQGEKKFPSTVITVENIDPLLDKYFLVEKPKKEEKGKYNDHPTVKPLNLCKFLIELTTKEKALVIDPFMGSGTTALACAETNRNFIGIEINGHYFDITIKRLKDFLTNKKEIEKKRDIMPKLFIS
ncbi:MAG: site-specific DNA-methyltransferase [Candidatus Omnitrophica bacterium]|nr:site-specific DNA-methyltransferase [Candidatus Omnitrophota bacterium]